MNALKNWWKVLSLSSSCASSQTEIKQFFSSPLRSCLALSRSTMTVKLWRTRKYNEMEILQMKTRQIRRAAKVSFATNSQPLSSHPDKQLNLSLVHCSLIYKAQNTFHSLFTKYLSLTLIKSAKKKRLVSSRRRKKENSSRRKKRRYDIHSTEFVEWIISFYSLFHFLSFTVKQSRKGMLTDFVGIATLLELPSFLSFCQSRPNSNITSLFLSVFIHSNAHRVDLFFMLCVLCEFSHRSEMY